MNRRRQADDTAIDEPSDAISVICLCAEWCGTCREYRIEFDRLASTFPDVRFLWSDIEDCADDLGDLDVENFPTLLIRRGKLVLFFGTLLPQIGLLRRLLESFLAQTREEASNYAFSTAERREWQSSPELLHIGAGAKSRSQNDPVL